MNETDHESNATLQKVLAFIDACDADKSVSTSAQTKPVETRKPRIQVGHEVKRLRREAKYLEMRLKQLTSSSARGNETFKANDKWLATVLEEYNLYRQSKRMNRQLKVLVAKQSQEIAQVLQWRRKMAAQSGEMEDLRIMASLTDRLSKLELDLDNVMTHAGLAQADSLTFRSLCKVDLDLTLVSERAFCYPVRCSLEQADSYLTIRFRQRAAVIKAVNDSGRLSKIVHFEHEKQIYQLHVKDVIRRIEQADRVVYLLSALSTIPQERLSFVEDCVYIVRRPPSSISSVVMPSSGSLLLAWHRIRAVHHGVSPRSTDRAFQSLKERVVSHENVRIESHLQSIKRQIQQ